MHREEYCTSYLAFLYGFSRSIMLRFRTSALAPYAFNPSLELMGLS